MKRIIIAATNKKKSLDQFAEIERKQYPSGMYSVGIDYEKNAVIVQDRDGNIVEMVYLDTQPQDVVRSKFRKATQKDISEGRDLYVKDTYETTTRKQIPKELSRVSVKDTF